MTEQLTTRLNGKPLKPGHPEYDEKASLELAKRSARILDRSRKDDESYYRQGIDYLVLRDRKLHRQAGYESLVLYVERVLDLDFDTLKACGRLAENFSLVQLRKHGRAKLKHVLTYVSLTLAEEEAWSLESVAVTLPGRPADAPPLTAAKATRAQMKAAVDHQRALALRRLMESTSGEARFAQELEGALLHENRSLATVRQRRSKTGHPHDAELDLTLRLGDLPALVHRLAIFLEEHDLPSLAAPGRTRRRG